MRPRTWTAIGLMSGTSTDGIDAALVDLRERPQGYEIRRTVFDTFKYSASLRRRLLAVAEGQTLTAETVGRLNVDLGRAFAAAAERMKAAPGTRTPVDVIGSHGHTIFHGPPTAGVVTPCTLQIGEAAVIAADTGITTVADFRPADVAAGGQGAPLAPYVHALLFRHATHARAVHNLGGISNVTYLPRSTSTGRIIAFDTGPANMVIDAVTSVVTGGRRRFDRNGRLAARGRVDDTVLRDLLRHPFLRRPLPKSTGREEFGKTFVERFLGRCRKRRLRGPDIVATATAFTARSIAQAYERYLTPLGGVDEVFCCGGGSRNPTLLAMIRDDLGGVRVGVTDDLGVDADALEAIAFAVLAVEAVRGRPANLPSVTGANRAMILGKIVPGEPRAFRRLTAKVV